MVEEGCTEWSTFPPSDLFPNSGETSAHPMSRMCKNVQNWWVPGAIAGVMNTSCFPGFIPPGVVSAQKGVMVPGGVSRFGIRHRRRATINPTPWFLMGF